MFFGGLTYLLFMPSLWGILNCSRFADEETEAHKGQITVSAQSLPPASRFWRLRSKKIAPHSSKVSNDPHVALQPGHK